MSTPAGTGIIAAFNREGAMMYQLFKFTYDGQIYFFLVIEGIASQARTSLETLMALTRKENGQLTLLDGALAEASSIGGVPMDKIIVCVAAQAFVVQDKQQGTVLGMASSESEARDAALAGVYPVVPEEVPLPPGWAEEVGTVPTSSRRF